MRILQTPAGRGVLVVTGIPGAGKSTVARAVASNFPRGAHIEGDPLGEMIAGGRVRPGELPAAESSRQLALVRRAAGRLCDEFGASGLIPVFDFVVLSRKHLAEFAAATTVRPISLVVLAPRTKAALARDAARPEKHVARHWTHLDAELRKGLTGLGLWLDTSAMSPEATVAAVLQRVWTEGAVDAAALMERN